MYYDHDMGWWGYAGMGIGMVLFFSLILIAVVAAVVFVRSDRSSRSVSTTGSPSPQNILEWRFARGEIDATEFRERTAVLQESTDGRRYEGQPR